MGRGGHKRMVGNVKKQGWGRRRENEHRTQRKKEGRRVGGEDSVI